MPLRRRAGSGVVAVAGPAIAAIIFVTAAAVWGQTPSSNQAPPNPPSSATSSKRAHAGLFVTLSRRSLFFPDIAATPGPLSPTGKFKLFVSDSISLSVLTESALSASIAQATNSPEGWGQGGEAYAKRFGSSMARRASSEFFGTFLLASMLHQDPRFFPEENPTLAGSVKYSVQRLFIARSDDGRDVANWPGLMGPLLAEGLANSYWPEQNRSAGETLERYGFDMATRVGTNMLRNYWPVFFKKMRGSRHSAGRS